MHNSICWDKKRWPLGVGYLIDEMVREGLFEEVISELRFE